MSRLPHRPTASLLAPLVLAPLLVAGAAGRAAASPYADPAQVASALRSDHVYVADDAEAAGRVDAARVRSAVGSAPVYVAVLPQRALDGTARQTAIDVGQRLGNTNAVVVVVVGTAFGAGQGNGVPLSSGRANQIAQEAFGGGTDPQGALLSVVDRVRSEARAGQASGGSRARTGGTGNGDNGGGGGGAALLGGIVAVGALGAGGYALSRSRRRKRREAQEAATVRAEVESLYARLGSDVSTLSPGDDRVAQQALADASERYTATGALLSRADIDTAPELEQAKRTAVEGLSAARVVRKQLGLDPGPDPMPAPPPSAPQVQGSQSVQVGDQQYQGYGSYQPGASHYFGGGYYQGGYVPGGWYQVPFWESLLIPSILFGGMGFGGGYGFGGYGGGGYGAGYDGGFDEGYERGQQSAGDSGWSGGGGGGDWGGGGGGGDFGGGGGGGDFGGGGGGGDGGGGGW